MDNLFKNSQNKIECQKNGICSKNPVLNSLEALIINEVRQIAFYSVKLKEFNFINKIIMEKGIKALTVSVSDIDFNKSAFLEFYNSIKNTKEEIENFYTKKIKENNLPLEFIAPVFSDNKEEKSLSSLIQKGEKIIKQFYQSTQITKSRLINLIISISKSASKTLIELSKYKEADTNYYFEILRLFSLTNFLGTREEKLKRRILEFSKIGYKLKQELNEEYIKVYGKIKNNVSIKTSIKKGNSILVSGPDIDELFKLLLKTKNENINVYITPILIKAFIYPAFDQFENFCGVFGKNDIVYDFSKFKGSIYLTSNFSNEINSSYRGSIYTTKTIYPASCVKITEENLELLIEKAKNTEGFDFEENNSTLQIENTFDKTINPNEKILIVYGFLDDKIKEKFKGYNIINFYIPNDTTYFYEAIEFYKDNKNIELYFANSTSTTLFVLSTILDKNFAAIYFEPVENTGINPHCIETLKKDFKINIV